MLVFSLPFLSSPFLLPPFPPFPSLFPNQTSCNCPQYDNYTSALGYSCNGVYASCESYLIYRTIPPYNTIASISSLLSVNASEVSAINNNISVNMALATSVDVIVPVTCSCSARFYQANTTYAVQVGNSYYTITNDIFRGLTTCNTILNQKRTPAIINIFPDERLTIPLRCACPTRRQVDEGIGYLMSYVIQKGDTIATIANKFGANLNQTLEANVNLEQAIKAWTTLLVPLQQPPNGSQMNYTFIESKYKRLSHFYTVVAVCVPTAIVILILSAACLYTYRRKSTTARSQDLEEFIAVESLRFDFKTIKNATNNFSQHNKLGQGGFGAVYKGILQSGQEIAVKRLSTNSGQGIQEFKTEVVLVEKLKHNNLVKLLGFCLHREEKLLVYELLPNASLDKILLDKTRQSTIDWETRYKIILGTARGLLYLHEDSRLKIIHRDLKPSNILLDENMNPKIADFGLARLVGRDQIHPDTSKIAGTYGYMAPEYAFKGRFSIMSDVYSFGVIALEVISGHMCRSTTFPYEDESLSLRAWRLWKECAALDLVDPRLNGSYISDEVKRCIHIGLLCIQEDANKRPTMASIVSALNGHPVALLEPEPPSYGPLINRQRETSSLKYFDGVSNNGDDITEIYPR